MPHVFGPEDAPRLMRWLSVGSKLADQRRGSRATHAYAIWLLIEDAVLITDDFPDQERRWLTSGFRSGGWSQVGMTPAEAILVERARSMAAMKPWDVKIEQKAWSDPSSQQRAMDCLSFLRWCGEYVKTEKPERMRKAAVVLARGGDGAAFSKVWMADARNVSRAAVSKFRHALAAHVLAGLREECGIVPDDTACGFKIR